MSDDPLVTATWLAERLDAPEIKIVDASWYLGPEKRSATDEYASAHIPGSVFFNIDAVAADDTDLPHMLPEPARFAAEIGKLGIANSSKVVVYDGWGVRSSARLWWTFRAMGHENVVVLDGGLPKWISDQHPVTDQRSEPSAERFTAHLDDALVRNRYQVSEALENGLVQVVDARPAARFRGEVPEPRAGLKAGHMPGAISLPMTELLNHDGSMKTREGLSEVFGKSGVDITKPIITSCGSGITACVLALGLARLGCTRTAVYDGSWAEWGQAEDCPVVTG